MQVHVKLNLVKLKMQVAIVVYAKVWNSYLLVASPNAVVGVPCSMKQGAELYGSTVYSPYHEPLT